MIFMAKICQLTVWNLKFDTFGDFQFNWNDLRFDLCFIWQNLISLIVFQDGFQHQPDIDYDALTQVMTSLSLTTSNAGDQPCYLNNEQALANLAALAQLSSPMMSLNLPILQQPSSMQLSNTTSDHAQMQIRCKFGTLGDFSGQFNSPHGFCMGLNEDIVVADTDNHRIQVHIFVPHLGLIFHDHDMTFYYGSFFFLFAKDTFWAFLATFIFFKFCWKMWRLFGIFRIIYYLPLWSHHNYISHISDFWQEWQL